MNSERQQINSNAGIHHTLSRQILGTDWYGTESSARRVIEWLAEGQEPVVWRFKERAEDMRSAWLYVKKRGHVPNGHPWQGLYAAPVSEAKAQVYEPLVCDYCNAETQDPWHGSGMLNGVESRHIHACSQCRNLLPTTKAQGVVMPAELDRAFITGESCDGVYRVAIQSETLKEMQAVHNWLARLNAAPAAPAADAGLVDMYRHLQTVTPYRFKKIQDASVLMEVTFCTSIRIVLTRLCLMTWPPTAPRSRSDEHHERLEYYRN